MGMIDRALGAIGFERRSTVASGTWDRVFPPAPGAFTPAAAENISTVLACTSAIATALAYIPAMIYQRDGDGNRVEVTGHPLTALTRNGPNPGMTWPELVEHWIASALLHGNGLLEITRDISGNLTGLVFIPWGQVAVQRLASGRLAYDVTDLYGSARNRRLLQGEVIHLRDRTDDGLIGRSRLSRAAQTVSGVASANSFAKSVLDNGGYPSGTIEHVAPMTPEQKAEIRAGFSERHAGAANAGRVLVLDGGLKFTAAQISPEDAELLESRRFGVEEICRLYQVPPPLVQDYAHNTFTNSEVAGRWFAQFTLAPWARKIEAAFSQCLFAPESGLEMEMDLSGFLRGDPTARWQSHKIAIDAGVLDPDEVRHIEGWNARKRAPL